MTTRQTRSYDRWRKIAQMMDPQERTIIANALRLAGGQYAADAAFNRLDAQPRVAEQFQTQADLCTLAADEVEL